MGKRVEASKSYENDSLTLGQARDISQRVGKRRAHGIQQHEELDASLASDRLVHHTVLEEVSVKLALSLAVEVISRTKEVVHGIAYVGKVD